MDRVSGSTSHIALEDIVAGLSPLPSRKVVSCRTLDPTIKSNYKVWFFPTTIDDSSSLKSKPESSRVFKGSKACQGNVCYSAVFYGDCRAM